MFTHVDKDTHWEDFWSYIIAHLKVPVGLVMMYTIILLRVLISEQEREERRAEEPQEDVCV